MLNEKDKQLFDICVILKHTDFTIIDAPFI